MLRSIDFVNTLAYGCWMTSKKLNTQDWIQAAFRALTAGGPEAIKAEAIARQLKVSKGSFYWHFSNVDALKTEMLEHWYKGATDDIISGLESKAQTPKDKLAQLVDITASDNSELYGGVSVEATIRDWGKYSTQAGSMVKKVDQHRMAFVHRQFSDYGYNDEQSKAYAGILYAGLIGLKTLSLQGLVDIKSDLHQLLKLLL